MTSLNSTEHEIQAAIIDLIRLRGGVVTRVNSGSMITKRGDQTYRVNLADKGTSDIIALYKGVYLAIEVKGSGGKPTVEQLSFLDSVAKAGGVGLLAYDVEFVEAALNFVDFIHEDRNDVGVYWDWIGATEPDRIFIENKSPRPEANR